jgi:hypothetical protein
MMRLTNLFCRDCCPDCGCNLYAAVAIPFDRAVGRRNAALAGTACDAGVHQLPVQDIEGQWLIYPTVAKH